MSLGFFCSKQCLWNSFLSWIWPQQATWCLYLPIFTSLGFVMELLRVNDSFHFFSYSSVNCNVCKPILQILNRFFRKRMKRWFRRMNYKSLLNSTFSIRDLVWHILPNGYFVFFQVITKGHTFLRESFFWIFIILSFPCVDNY